MIIIIMMMTIAIMIILMILIMIMIMITGGLSSKEVYTVRKKTYENNTTQFEVDIDIKNTDWIVH